MEGAAPASSSPRGAVLLLALILAGGLAVRFVYLDWRLDSQRFWDERFSFENVAELHETGRLAPANGYYPLLSYLPQALLLSLSERLHEASGAAWLAVRDGDGFTAHAYRLSRLVHAVWGLLAVWLTFLVGRRLFSEPVGLLAAAVVAFSPGQIHASGVFKPDSMLVLTVLLALHWGLAAARRPSAGAYALAGGGVALAMSSKLTGGLACLPLVLDSLARGRREPRRLALLALAGGVALALFLLLNPHWRLYFDYLDKLGYEYRWMADAEGMTRWQIPARTVGFLLKGLGPAITAAAAVAGAALLLGLARRRLAPESRPSVAMLLFLPPAWVAGYMVATAQFKSNNLLPIVPPLAIVAAWGLEQAWRRLAGRAPAERRRLVAALGLALVALAIVPRGLTYVYRSRTPSGEDLALRFAERRSSGHPSCQLVLERAVRRWPPWERARAISACHVRVVDSLTRLEPTELSLADGVLFPQRRLAGGGAATYLAAVATAEPGGTAVWAPAAFRVRRPGFVVALHPWAPREPPRRLLLRPRHEGDYRLEADLPAELEPGEVLSFSLWLPRPALAADLPPPRLKTGGREIELSFARAQGRGFVYLTPRLSNRQPGPRVRLNRDRLAWDDGEIRLTLWRWRRQEPTVVGARPRVSTPPRNGEPRTVGPEPLEVVVAGDLEIALERPLQPGVG